MSNTFIAIKKRKENYIDFFRRQLGDIVLDVGLSSHNEAYIALKAENGVTCAIAFMKHLSSDNGVEEREITVFYERECPPRANCPKKIFDMLSHPDQIYDRGTQPWLLASGWRTAVTQQLIKKEKARQIAIGQTIRFAQQIGNLKYTDFRRINDTANRRDLFECIADGTTHRIPDWKERTFMAI